MTNVSSERILAFIPQWEYQCCGDPIDVGTTRDLTLVALDDDSTLTSPLAMPVTAVVEHHEVNGEPRHVRARIMELWEARREYELRHDALHPVVGRDEFASIRHMEVWDRAWKPTRTEARPAGWVVDLVVLAELPDRDILYGQDA